MPLFGEWPIGIEAPFQKVHTKKGAGQWAWEAGRSLVNSRHCGLW